MAVERRPLDELLAAVDGRLAALVGPLARDIAALIRRSPKSGGTLSPVGRRGVAAWLTTAIAALFGASPADADGLYAVAGTVPHLVAGATRAAATLAAGPVVADATARLAGQPGLLAALAAGNGTPPAAEPSRTWRDPNGRILSDRVWQAGEDLRARLDALLDHHIARGTTTTDLASAIEGFLTPEGAKPRTRTPYGTEGGYSARRLARSETTKAYGQATIASASANPFVRGIRWRLSAAHPESDRCDERAAADPHGLGAGVYRVGEVPSYPDHPQCFPAGTIVSGPPIVASTERWYAGDIVEIETVGGRVLTVTPNHPILTSHGWVAAGQLHEGGDVISGIDPQRMLARVNPNNDYVEALIEEVAITLGGATAVATVRVPTAPEDFHHDGADSQVSVVRTDRHLRDARDPALLQPALQDQFAGGHAQLAFLPRDRALALGFPRLRDAPAGDVRGRGLGHSLLGRHAGNLETLRFGAGTGRDASRQEALANGVAGYAEAFRQGQFGLTRPVERGNLVGRQHGDRGGAGLPGFSAGKFSRHRRIAPEPTGDQFFAQPLVSDLVTPGSVLAGLAGLVREDRILNVRRRGFRGHVYNLQTTESWYSANGIIVHNCLCALLPVVVRDGTAVIAALARGELPVGRPLDEAAIVAAVTGFPQSAD